MKMTILLLLSAFIFNCTNENQISQDYLATGWYEISNDNTGVQMQLDRSEETYRIIPTPVISSNAFDEIYIYETGFGTADNPNYGLVIILEDQYTKEWSELTERSIGKRIAFILDNALIATPEVNSRIDFPTTAINRLDYSKSDLEEFMKKIKKTSPNN